jgi:hypothetical protein
MKRSHWLPLITVAGVALLAIPLLSVAQAQGPSLYNPDLTSSDLRKPSTPYAPAERLPKTGKQADLLASTDFYQFVTTGRERASNPDIAVGPDDIFVVAGQNRIMRIPNPNSPGFTLNGGNLPYTRPAPTSPGTPSPLANLNALRAGVPTSEVFLDTWVGTDVLNDICPGQFNPQTCLIQYPTVRYDQMHGHFLVAFAITDTGVRGPDQQVTQGRASTWVLIVSKYASFADVPSGTSQIFTTPLPPADIVPPGGGSSTGGIDANKWAIYYGARDGAVTAGGNMLNINMYSTHPTARPLSAPGRYNASFPVTDCNAPVGNRPPVAQIPQGEGTEETVCLFPTEVRLGIDNDSIILVSPVYNVNQIVPNSNTIPFTTGRYAGNRVRVLSKYAIYNFLGLTNGNWLIPGAYNGPVPYNPNVGSGFIVNPPQFTQFDLFRNEDLPAFCSVFDFATDTCTTTVPGFPPRRYTLGLEVSPTGSGIDAPRPPDPPTTLSSLYPLYYEPVHLRGRAMASFSNYPLGGYTHLIGSFSFGTVGSGGNLWVQPIVYRPDYRPALDPGDQAVIGINGPRRQLVPDTVIDPLQVPQRTTCSTSPCSSDAPANPANNLYIGNSRPQRAVYREGHIYDARQGRPSSNIFGTSISTPPANNANTANQPLWSTVYYDVIQMRQTSPIPAVTLGFPGVFQLPLPNPSLIFYTFWQNGHFYAPMFDVTANVQQSGALSPSWTLPYFEKLFVGTTSPRFFFPAVSGQGNIWPSLYDVRQGVDKYDRFEWFRDPRTGRVINPLTEANSTNLLTTRAGAATDPNLGGLWVYGAFADFRIAGGVGQWATHAAYYDMSFNDTDPYGTDARFFADVPETHPFFVYIQTARQIGLTQFLMGQAAIGSASAGNPPHGSEGTKPNFEPNRLVTRAEMAAFIVYSTMDPRAVHDYLSKTLPTVALPANLDDAGGATGTVTPTFADSWPGRTGSDPAGNAVTLSPAQFRAIEVLVRRGYTRGCLLTNDGTFNFCPFDWTTRAQMAVFVIRAKMNNVHPTVLSGCPATQSFPNPPFQCVNGGDNFWTLQRATPYFPGDTPVTHPFYGYIQKMRELRITNGITATQYGSEVTPTDQTAANPNLLTRGQMATFIVRAFHF